MDRDDLLFSAELSTRYHRRRAMFLERLSTSLTAVTLLLSTAAFSVILAQVPAIAAVATVMIALISVVQVMFRPQAHATQHAQWLRRWNAMLLDIKITPQPTTDKLAEWAKIKYEIETEHVSELRALQADCYNRATAHLGWPKDHNYVIKPKHRWLMQVVSFEHSFGDQKEK